MRIRPFSPGAVDLRPSQFTENVWSKRLTLALAEFLPEDLGSQVRYTAEDGPSFAYKQFLKSGIPSEAYLLFCYLFRGASDVNIKNKPLVE